MNLHLGILTFFVSFDIIHHDAAHCEANVFLCDKDERLCLRSNPGSPNYQCMMSKGWIYDTTYSNSYTTSPERIGKDMDRPTFQLKIFSKSVIQKQRTGCAYLSYASKSRHHWECFSSGYSRSNNETKRRQDHITTKPFGSPITK